MRSSHTSGQSARFLMEEIRSRNESSDNMAAPVEADALLDRPLFLILLSNPKSTQPKINRLISRAAAVILSLPSIKHLWFLPPASPLPYVLLFMYWKQWRQHMVNPRPGGTERLHYKKEGGWGGRNTPDLKGRMTLQWWHIPDFITFPFSIQSYPDRAGKINQKCIDGM